MRRTGSSSNGHARSRSVTSVHRGRSSAGRSAEVLLADLVVPIVTLFCLAAMQVRAEQNRELAERTLLDSPHTRPTAEELILFYTREESEEIY